MPDAIRLTRIDETNIRDHFHLNPSDECYFLFEYTSGYGYSFSSTNSLISNLKKKPSSRGTAAYQYKQKAIQECSQHLSSAINSRWLDIATLVPVPGSKAQDHPDYDDRMTRICRGIRSDPQVDVRDLVKQTISLEAAHETVDARPTVEQLTEIYQLDENLTSPTPACIGIFDDVLTAGVHYRAIQTLLTQRFPGVP